MWQFFVINSLKLKVVSMFMEDKDLINGTRSCRVTVITVSFFIILGVTTCNTHDLLNILPLILPTLGRSASMAGKLLIVFCFTSYKLLGERGLPDLCFTAVTADSLWWMLQTPASPPSTASESKSPVLGTKERKGTDGWDTEEWGSLEEDPVLDPWERDEHFTRANRQITLVN